MACSTKYYIQRLGHHILCSTKTFWHDQYYHFTFLFLWSTYKSKSRVIFTYHCHSTLPPNSPWTITQLLRTYLQTNNKHIHITHGSCHTLQGLVVSHNKLVYVPHSQSHKSKDGMRERERESDLDLLVHIDTQPTAPQTQFHNLSMPYEHHVL